MNNLAFVKSKILVFLCCSFFLLSWKAAGPSVKHVDLVFCVDLSASTNGILNDVRDKMWNISNGILQKNEATDLRIAVVGYGRPSFGSSDNYVRIISELTSDFDKLHFELHQLKAVIEKGDQFVPSALRETYRNLKWSKDADADKMVYLIGNGSVYTGTLNLNEVCEDYRKNNIRINTIYVSQSKDVPAHIAGYRNIATVTNGKFYTVKPSLKTEINKNVNDAHEVISMSNSMNSTFMFYTKDAAERKKFQLETDKNTLKMGVEYFYSRLLYKTSELYLESAASYDLTSYLLKYGKMPERVNMDYLMATEKTDDLSVIEDRARKKIFARIRLDDEIKWMFRQIEKDTVEVNENLLDGFVLSCSR